MLRTRTGGPPPRAAPLIAPVAGGTAGSVVIMTGERDLRTLLSGMRPELNAGRYVFTTVPDGVAPTGVAPVVTVTEREGLTLVVPEEEAVAAGLTYDFVAA